MAGKHVGSAAFVSGLTHPAPYPAGKENKAFAEGYNGNPVANPHTSGTPAYTAYEAGADTSTAYETDGDKFTRGTNFSPITTGTGSEIVILTPNGWSNGTITNLGYLAGNEFQVGIRYTLTAGPDTGATIDSATLTLQVDALDYADDDPVIEIWSQTGNNPAAFSASGGPAPTTITASKTSTVLTPDLPVATGAWVVDVKTLLQELVDQGTWDAGESINIVLENTVSAVTTSYVRLNHGTGSVLNIIWS